MKVKSQLNLILIIGLLFSLTLTACSGFNLYDKKGGIKDLTEEPKVSQADARPQIQRILDLIETDDCESLLEWVCPKALEKYGRKQIIDRNRKIHQGIDLKKIQLKDFAPLDEKLAGDLISYQGTATYVTGYGDLVKAVTYNFIYQPKANRWQLDWTPSVILPGLHDQGLVQVLPLQAKRGSILDRQGKKLASQAYVDRIGLVPKTFNRQDAPLVESAFNLPEGYVDRQLDQEWVKEDMLVPLKTLPSLDEDQKEAVQKYHLSVEPVESRSYPLGPAAAHLIGYVGYPTAEDLAKEENSDLTAHDFIGKSGLEALYESQLRGKNGFKLIVTGDYQQVLLEEEPVNGQDIHLTIDSDLQKQIYEMAKDRDACFTALDPRNGDLLALLSTPSYEPQDFVLGISQSAYEDLVNNPKKPLFNKFIGAMTPGSTEKVLTSIAGFHSGTLTPTSSYNIQGKGWTYDSSWGNYQVIRYEQVDGDIDFTQGLARSDNIFFARLALDMGMEKFTSEMDRLRFGQEICPDYPFGRAQLTNSGQLGSTILLADAAYGQGELLISQAHLASIFGAVANKGCWYRPRLLLSSNTEVLEEQIVDQVGLTAIDKALRQVCTGTYPSLNISEASLAGKSGTAEVGYDESSQKTRQNSSFIAYDQANPTLVLAVTCFDTHNQSFTEAVDLTKQIFQKVYQAGPYRPAEAVQ